MVLKDDDLEPIEFTVSTNDIYGLDNHRNRLKKLFDVQLGWRRDEELSNEGDCSPQWFSITEGSTKARQLAKV